VNKCPSGREPKNWEVDDENGLNRKWRELSPTDSLKTETVCEGEKYNYGSRIPPVSFHHNSSRDPTKQDHYVWFPPKRSVASSGERVM
jgi:hypothetical protein